METVSKYRFKGQAGGGIFQSTTTGGQPGRPKQQLNEANIMKYPEYYNPDPLIYLIGRANK